MGFNAAAAIKIWTPNTAQWDKEGRTELVSSLYAVNNNNNNEKEM